MITGFEGLIKITPIIGALILGGMAYGEIKSDIENLKVQQQQQYTMIQKQLDQIQDQLNNKQNR